MRRLIIAVLSALILLCAPISTLQGCGLHSIRRNPLMTNLSGIGAPVDPSLRPTSQPIQAPAGERGAAQSDQASISLEPGKPIERELSGGQSHSYRLTMNSGQYLHIVVEQREIDVAVSVYAPDGKKISDVDINHMIGGKETVSTIAEAAGAYLIEARSQKKAAGTGRYVIKVEDLRTASIEDKYRVAGESIFREADQLDDGKLEDRRKSIDKYHEALELFRKANHRNGEAVTISNLGTVYWGLGEMQKALDKYKEALPIFQAMGDRKQEADTLGNIGTVYSGLGEMDKALEMFNDTLPIIQETGDRRTEAFTLNNIGMIYLSSGETQRAIETINKSLSLWQRLGDRRLQAATLNNIGLAHRGLGEMQKALDKYYESLPIRREVADRNGEATTLINISDVYLSLGETQKALDKLNDALRIFKEIGGRRGEALALVHISSAYRYLGQMDKALEKYNEALTTLRAIGDRNGEGSALHSAGEVYRALGQMDKALEKYNEALTTNRAVSDRRAIYRRGEGTTLSSIGSTYFSLGDLQKALDKYNEALPIRREAGDRIGEASTLLGIARVEQKRGALIQSRQLIEQAVSIIESVRADIDSPELRASFFATRQDSYESYIDVLLQMHKQSPDASFEALALTVSERARARSLLELLIEARADIREGVDSSLLERERYLRRRLAARAAAQTRLLNSRHTPAQAEAAAKEIASITDEYEEIQRKIRDSSPRYAALTQPQPLNLSEIQKQILDPDTLLLEYSLGEYASYLFLVSQTSISSYQLPKRAEIEAAARRVHELLTATQPRPGETEAKRQGRIVEANASYWPKAVDLGRMLLGPVASKLGKKRLVIIADGALQYIPFAALPVPSARNDENRNSGAEPQPLIVEHEIVSLPSASTLAELRRETAGRKPAEKTLAVLADPVFSDDDTRVRRNVSKVEVEEKTRPADSAENDLASLQMARSGKETGVVDAEGGFGRLLSTRSEATAILAMVPERERMQALDFEASRTTALRPDMGEYRIVHFATHGLLNNIHPALSGVVLSLVDKNGRQQDGFLRLQDIYNLKLPAELVVLSACQTGLGKDIKREGLIGLTRGFMFAGAPRIVASLWKVDDRATSELMKRFYQGMLGPERLRPAEALRQAQLSIWKQKQWRAPYYWAAFVIQGEWK